MLLLGLSLFFASLLLYKLVKHGKGVHISFVLTSAALALPFAWATKFSFENKLRICLFSLSSILTVLALDVAVLVLHVEPFEVPLQARYTAREKLAVLSTLRQTGPAYPAMVPYLFIRSNGLATGTDRVFPMGGISRVVTLVSKESGSWSKYLSDEHGFNNPPGCQSSDASPIVLIGDSMVDGARVPGGDDIATKIRDLGYPAVNLGFGANGPLLELAMLSEYGLRLRPRAVIWAYFDGNDLDDLAGEKTSLLLRAYLHDGYS